MIIFGLAVFFFGTLGEGTFHCPTCGGDRPYRHKAGRRWFTLFFLPVIPLGRVGEMVRCGTCRTRYDPRVLAAPTAEQLSEVGPSAVRSAVAIVLNVGNPEDQTARRRAIDAVRGAGIGGYDDADLAADLARPAEDGALRTAAEVLAPHGRERLMSEAAHVGLATGPLSETQRHTLGLIGDRLGLTPAQAFGVIGLAEQGAQRG